MKQSNGERIRCSQCNTLEHWRLHVTSDPRDNEVAMDCGHVTTLLNAVDQIQMMHGSSAVWSEY